MSDTLTTTAQVDPAVALFYDRNLIEAARPELVHECCAQFRPIPKKSGNTIKFRRYSNLSVADTPLTEGVTPPGQALAKTDITATISWYGDFVHVTDVVDATVEDPELTVASQKLGFQMGQTRDKIVRDVLAACASSSNATKGSNGNTPTEITRDDIDSVVKTLLSSNAKMTTPAIPAGEGVGTAPVRRAYWGIADTDLVDDLEAVEGFKSISEYASQSGTAEAEWGATGNVRWLLTSEGYVTEDTPAVYRLPILGRDAYGVTELTDASANNIIKPFGSGGSADPLNQRASSGWKMGFVARILNDNFMHVLKVTHS